MRRPAADRDDTDEAPIRYATWIGACASGEAAGLVCAGSLNAVLAPALLEGGAEPWVLEGLMVAAGAIEGLCLGAAQWLALRRALPMLRATHHIAATSIGMALGWWLGALAARLEPAATPGPALVVAVGAMTGIALGAVVGLAQAFVLRRVGVSAPVWIGLSTLAWTVGMALSYVGAALIPAGDWDLRALLVGLATGGVIGGVVGAITRPALR
jgi:hypothetical protein